MRKTLTFLLAPSALLVLLAVACADSSDDSTPTGTSDASDDDRTDAAKDARNDSAKKDTGPACKLSAPYTKKNAACNACAEANCCESVNACVAETKCFDDYVNCSLACALESNDAAAGGDPVKDCLAQCDKDSPEGAVLYKAFSACIDGACTADCK